jgi:hypothetical protein
MNNKNGRIPKSPAEFNAYINNTESYLRINPGVAPLPPDVDPPEAEAIPPLGQPNWARLGMIQSEMDMWTNFKSQWNILYPSYSDKEESRTTVIKENLFEVESEFMVFARPILNMISGMRTVTNADAAVLHIVINRASPTHPVTPILEIPTFSATPLGGAEIQFSFRPTHDSTRASKLPGATGIELSYEVGDGTTTTVTDNHQLFSSTKSIFVLKLPQNSKGKTLFVSARWIVANSPERNGPWSGMSSVIVA